MMEKNDLIVCLEHEIQEMDDRVRVLAMLVGERTVRVAELERENKMLKHALSIEAYD